MPSPSNASARKSTALAANAMISEGGAVEQPSKEESEAILEQAAQEQRSKGKMRSATNKSDQDV